jgi:hypothetical protein
MFMDEMENEEQQGLEEVEPTTSQEVVIVGEQHTITFYEKPILVVRLDDGRPAVVLRSLCDNLSIDTNAQVRRVRRTEAIAEDLAQTQIETEGGQQKAYVLVLRSVPYWLATLDPKRARPEVREEIVRYQRECVDVLYEWAGQRLRALPAPAGEAFSQETMIAEQPATYGILAPMAAPDPEATHRERATYHEIMSVWHRHQADLHAQAWRAEVDARMDSQEVRIEAREALTDLIPEILERLGPQTITPEHQRRVQALVGQLAQASGKHRLTIYDDLKTAFSKPRYQDLLEDEWSQVERWFKGQIERAKKKPGR